MIDDDLAIANLVHAYAERVDAGDFAGVGELFEHATYRAELPGGAIVCQSGSDKVARLLQGLVMTYDGTPATKHVTTNLIIEVNQPSDTASCRSYYTVLQAAPGSSLQPIIAGRYHDTFARVDGAWRFADRVIYSDLFGDLSRHLRRDPYRP